MEIKIARTSAELEQVYKLRYQVYVEEEKKFGGIDFSGKMIKDEFDDHPNTFNLLMLDNEVAVGVVRLAGNLTEHEELPSDKIYDFDVVRKNHPGLIPGNIGMLAIRKAYQSPKIFTSLMLVLCKLSLKHKYDYHLCTTNHECCNLFRRIMGGKIICDKFWSAEIGNYIVPMIMYKEQVVDYIKRFGSKSSLTN